MTTNASAKQEFLERLGQQIPMLVPPGERIVVAVSGGPDSVALLMGWQQLAQDLGHSLTVAHYNHATRQTSDDDARFVQSLAHRLGLLFVGDKASTEKSFTEENARKKRYQFLGTIAQELACPFVATGHTWNDQVETVLMAIARGTGLHGLRGMQPSRPLHSSATLVRPMLTIRRESIAKTLEQFEIQPCKDPTNDELRFTRNRVRNVLMPCLVETFGGTVGQNLLRLAMVADRTRSLIDRLARQLLERAQRESGDATVALSLDEMKAAEPELVPEVIRLVFVERNWPRKHLGQVELDRVASMLTTDQPRVWELPGGVRVERTKGTLVLTRGQ